MILIRLIIGFLIQIVPCCILCYFPFIDNLKFNSKKLIIFSICEILLISVVFASSSLFLSNFFVSVDELNLYINILFMLSLIIFLFTYFFTVNTSTNKKIFVFILSANYGLIISIFSNLLISYLNRNIPFDGYPYDIVSIFFIFITTIITLPPILYLMSKNFNNLISITPNRGFGYLSFVTATYFLIFSFVMIFIDTSQYFKPLSILVFLCLTLGIFFVYYFIFRFLNETIKNTEMEKLTAALKYSSQLQAQQFNYIQSNIETAMKRSHDLKHNLSVLAGLAANGNIDEIQNYLNHYIKSLPEITFKQICDNSAINAILQYYTSASQQSEINFNIRVDISEISESKVPDICIILGNLLSNAFEACNETKGVNKFVTLNIVKLKHGLAITVDNNFSGNAIFKNNRYISTKESGAGLGLLSIISISEKYNGGTSFEHDNNTFHSSVVLKFND